MQQLPYESQVYINTNIGMLRSKFADFIAKYAQPGVDSTIKEEDVKRFFKELND